MICDLIAPVSPQDSWDIAALAALEARDRTATHAALRAAWHASDVLMRTE
ncbi:MAG: hypothetical protein JW751_03545 [Polyangiaceae bacterium]|nr:hypothetical protein [Polyangiaceae bacterium]